MPIKTESGKKLAKAQAKTPAGMKKIKELYSVAGGKEELLWRAELPVQIDLSVLNGFAVNQLTYARAEKDYIIPKGFTKARLEKVELSKPFGQAEAMVQLNWYTKARAGNAYYGGGWVEDVPDVPQEWDVKEGDIVHLILNGYTNANVSPNQYTTLHVLLVLS